MKTDNLKYTVSMAYAALSFLSEEVFSSADIHQDTNLHGVAYCLETISDSLERSLKTSETD